MYVYIYSIYIYVYVLNYNAKLGLIIPAVLINPLCPIFFYVI